MFPFSSPGIVDDNDCVTKFREANYQASIDFICLNTVIVRGKYPRTPFFEPVNASSRLGSQTREKIFYFCEASDTAIVLPGSTSKTMSSFLSESKPLPQLRCVVLAVFFI
jgi:hypothetical protein